MFSESKEANIHEQCRLVTVLTPTMNRPEFILRYLHYYAKIGFSGDIIIGDSSDEQNRDVMEKAVKKYANNLSLRYIHYPSVEYAHDGICVQNMLEQVTTPYAVFCGDDDFLIPEGVACCVDIMEHEEGYAGVFGERVAFQLDRNGPSGKLIAMSRRNSYERLQNSALERLNHYITEGMSTQYSVIRTKVWKRMYKEVPKIPARYLGSEFFPCCISVMQGKLKKIDTLMVLFQQNLDPILNWNKKTLFALMSSAEWAPSVSAGRSQVIDELVRLSDLTREQAESYVDVGIWHHMLKILNSQYNAVAAGKSLRPGISPEKGKLFLDEFMQNSEYRRLSLPALKTLAGVR